MVMSKINVTVDIDKAHKNLQLLKALKNSEKRPFPATEIIIPEIHVFLNATTCGIYITTYTTCHNYTPPSWKFNYTFFIDKIVMIMDVEVHVF